MASKMYAGYVSMTTSGRVCQNTGPHVNLCASVTCPQGTLCQQVNNTHHTCVCEVQALGSYKRTVLWRQLRTTADM
jgi:hypothetical protein